MPKPAVTTPMPSPTPKTAGLPPGVSEEQLRADLVEYQTLQQQLQFLAMQRQQNAMQAAELEKAKEEAEKASGTLYRSMGAILIPKQKDILIKELADEKETIDVRSGALQKQEEKLKERFTALRQKLEALQRGA